MILFNNSNILTGSDENNEQRRKENRKCIPADTELSSPAELSEFVRCVFPSLPNTSIPYPPHPSTQRPESRVVVAPTRILIAAQIMHVFVLLLLGEFPAEQR